MSAARRRTPPIEGLPPGFGTGAGGRVAFGVAIAFAAFQLWTAAYGALPSQVVRAMHVGFLLLLGFGLIGDAAGADAGGAGLVLERSAPRLPDRALQLGVLRRPDPARGLPDAGRPRRRAPR